MEEHQIPMNEITYEHVINRLVAQGNLELALQWLAEMGDQELSPTLRTVQSLIQLAAQMSHARLAIDLAINFENSSPRLLDAETWYQCLISAARTLYADGVIYAWDKTVNVMNQTVDEGCCIAALHTAGRHGLSSLALDIIQQLKTIGATWQEHHFAPVVEAFCRAGNIREAFATLTLMRSSDIEPVLETAYPIYREIVKNTDKVDEAWAILEDMKKEGRAVDVVAYNALIQACVGLGDLQRALGTYKAAEELGVKPDVETFNLLLYACIAASHRELGDRLLTEMREASVRPNIRTYERLIVLCLTQPTYEEAFYYLEEMKSTNLVPTASIYEAIIRKCCHMGDTRYHLALEEMKETGYEVSAKLQQYIDNGGYRKAPGTNNATS